MSANVRVVLVLTLLLAGAGLIAFFAVQDPAPKPTGPDDSAATEPEVAAPPVVTGRPGTLTGVVQVFQTKKPAAGIEVRIEGAGEPITTETKSLGIFTARVPSGPEVTVTAFATKPYADVVVRGVTVKPDSTTSIGTLYLERALLLRGIVVDAAGAPIPGATVSAHRPTMGEGPATDFLEVFSNMTKRRTPLDTATTDDGGRFALRKLSPGTYRLEACAEGFAVGVAKDVMVAPEAERVEHRIVLRPGFRLHGDVATAQGVPVPGAVVSMIRTDAGPGGLPDFSPIQTESDEEGRFSFDNLPPGRSMVSVRADGFPMKMQDGVRVGQQTTVKIVLGGTAVVEGRVTSKDGAPVEGANIMVAIGQRGGAFGETVTDTDGRYRMEHLPEGRIQFMRVEALGYAGWPVIDNPMMFQRGFGEVRAGKPLVKDIELSAGTRVFGRITSKVDGRPIEGARVYLLGGLSVFTGPGGEAVTDEEGNYEISAVAKGLHQVVVKAPGFYQTGLDPNFATRTFGFGTGGKPPEGAPEVTTTEGGPDQRLDIALLTGATVVGTVVTPDNRPVAGAKVTVTAKPNAGMIFMPGARAPAGPTAISDENGAFRLVGLEAGSAVKFEAEAADWVKGVSEPVALTAGQETPGVVVTMRLGGSLTGTITSYEGGPLANAEVRTMVQPANAAGNPWQWEWQLQQVEPALTDEDGRFRVEGLPPGTYIVRFGAPGHRVVTKLDVAVPEGADGGPLDLKLEKGLQISGVVVDTDGNPVRDVNLWTNVVMDGGQGNRTSIRNATSDENGEFLLDQLEAGTYSLSVNANGYANRSLQDVDAGTGDLRIVLEKGLSISGRVLLPDGSPAENLWVSAQGEGSSSNDRTDEDGTFRIENLPEGVYTVRANPSGAFRFMGAKDEGPSLIAAAQEGVAAGSENIELRLRAGAAIAGRVTDEQGQPIAGASIFSRSMGEGDQASGWSQTDANGEFRVTGLTPGSRISVSVSHGDYGPLPLQEVEADAAGLIFVLPPKPDRWEGPEGVDEATPR